MLDYLFSAGFTKTYEQMKQEVPSLVCGVVMCDDKL